MRKQLQKSYLSWLYKELEPNTNTEPWPQLQFHSLSATPQQPNAVSQVWNPDSRTNFKSDWLEFPTLWALWSLEGTSPPWTRWKILVKLPGWGQLMGITSEVTWMSLRRLVNLSTRGTHSGPRRVSQLGCMYSEARRWASLSSKNNQRMVSRCMGWNNNFHWMPGKRNKNVSQK